MKKKLIIVGLVILALLTLDQVIKIYIKTYFAAEQHHYLLGNWFAIHFIENQGMAFGTTFGSAIWHKLGLSIFRVVAIGFIAYYIIKEAKKGAKLSFLIAMGFIWAGATGNLIDSMFYDFFFSFNPCDRFNYLEGSKQFADCMVDGRAFPVEVRHRGFLLGNVVDMFQFDVLWPKWVPYFGGGQIFPAIWNVADASITTGVAIIIIRQKSFFPKTPKQPIETKEADENP